MNHDADEIDVQALAELRDKGLAHTLLDVREPVETDFCVLEDSLLIPMQQVPQRLRDLPKDRPLVVLCHHGIRSRQVMEFLRGHGFNNALNLTGGMDAWSRKIDAGVPRY